MILAFLEEAAARLVWTVLLLGGVGVSLLLGAICWAWGYLVARRHEREDGQLSERWREEQRRRESA